MPQELPKYDYLLHELEQLKSENARLKELLRANGIAYEVVPADIEEERIYSDITFPDAHLGKDERVALFRSLFRGREATLGMPILSVCKPRKRQAETAA